MSIFRIPRTAQPQGPVGIDWANPITRGLIFAPMVVGSRFRNAVEFPSSPSNASLGYSVVTDNDVRAIYTHANYKVYIDDGWWPWLRLVNDVTFFAIAKTADVNRNTYGQYIVSTGTSGGSGDSGGIAFKEGKLRAITGAVPIDGITPLSNNTYYRLAYTRRLTAPSLNLNSLYVDGKLDTSANGGVSAASDVSRLSIGTYGDYDPNVLGLLGHITTAMVWNRALSDKEIASISVNPWQIFKPIDVNPQFITNARSRIVVPTEYFGQRKSMMLGSSVKEDGSNLIKAPKIVRTTQPQGPAGIDPLFLQFNPQRLVNFANEEYDIVKKERLIRSPGAFSSVSGKMGKGLSFGASDGSTYLSAAIGNETSSSLTMVWVGSISSTTTATVVRDNTASSGTLLWNNVGGFDVRVGATDYVGGGSWSINTDQIIVLRSGHSGVSLWANGIRVVSGPASAGSSLISPWRLHRNGTLGQGVLATSKLWAVFAKPVPELMAKELSLNPWQIFKPDQCIIGVSS